LRDTRGCPARVREDSYLQREARLR
jgi:hypothetical protein